MKKLRILIADDHEIVRAGVRALLERQPGWEVCGIAVTGREAIEQAIALKPAVVLLDMTMPEMNGLEAVRQIKRSLPETEIVMFSGHFSEQLIKDAFDAGAKSYVRKADASQHLVDAVRAAAEHKPFFTAEVSEVLFAKFLSPGKTKASGQSEDKLTTREREILRLLAEGHSNKDLASTLGISVRTAETHRATVMRKCGVDSLAGLVRYAIRNHIIDA